MNGLAHFGMFSFGSLDSLASPPKMMAFWPTTLKECPRRGQGGSPKGVSLRHSQRLASSSYNYKQTNDNIKTETVQGFDHCTSTCSNTMTCLSFTLYQEIEPDQRWKIQTYIKHQPHISITIIGRIST